MGKGTYMAGMWKLSFWGKPQKLNFQRTRSRSQRERTWVGYAFVFLSLEVDDCYKVTIKHIMCVLSFYTWFMGTRSRSQRERTWVGYAFVFLSLEVDDCYKVTIKHIMCVLSFYTWFMGTRVVVSRPIQRTLSLTYILYILLYNPDWPSSSYFSYDCLVWQD